MVTRTRGETRRQQWARGKCRYSPLVGISSLLQFSSLTSKQVSTFEILLKKSPRFQNIWTFLLLTVLSIRLYRTAHLKTSHDPKDTPVMFRNFRISQFVLTEIPTGKPLLHKAVQFSGTVWKSNYTNWCYSLLALVIEDYLCLHFILQISFVWFLFLFFSSWLTASLFLPTITAPMSSISVFLVHEGSFHQKFACLTLHIFSKCPQHCLCHLPILWDACFYLWGSS